MPGTKRSYSSYAGPAGGENAKKRKMQVKKNVVGNIGGRVSASNTTLAKAKGPFAATKYMTFVYENELTAIPSATAQSLPVMANSLYDFDQTSGNTFGNKQPLYMDSLLTSSGPYKQYRVISWKTTYTVFNLSTSTPITVWAIPPVSATAEIDSAAEADNFPGSKSLYLGPQTSSKNMGEVTVYGHTDDVYSAQSSLDTLTAQWNANPLSPIYQGLYIRASDGSTAPSVYVAVRHEAYTQLGLVDSLVS